MTFGAGIMRHTWAYRLFQAPFAEAKLAPLFAHNDMSAVRRVLDVGCGPGTNTHHFADTVYLGVDHNPQYIDYARKRHGREFLVADITTWDFDDQVFDCILVNSFLHHIDTPNVRKILSHLDKLLSDDGRVHVFDLVLPERTSIPRFLARLDRGDYPRPLGDWRHLLSERFHPMVLEPYTFGAMGVTLWNMVYFKGKKLG